MSSGPPYNHQHAPGTGQQGGNAADRTPQPFPYGYPPQQNATGSRPHSYQAQQHGYAAPPGAPSQQYGAASPAATSFEPPPLSTPAAMQATARSFFKVGKGVLGDLASNIKAKYPTATSANAQQQIHDVGQPSQQQQPWHAPSPAQHGTPPAHQTYNPPLTQYSQANQNILSTQAGHPPSLPQSPYTAPPSEYYPSPPFPMGQSFSHGSPPAVQHARPYTQTPPLASSPYPQEYQQPQKSSFQAPWSAQSQGTSYAVELEGSSPGEQINAAAPIPHAGTSNTIPVMETGAQAHAASYVPTGVPPPPPSQTISSQSVHQTATFSDYVRSSSPPPIPPQHTRPDMTTSNSHVPLPPGPVTFSTSQEGQVNQASVPQPPVHPSSNIVQSHSSSTSHPVAQPHHDQLGSLSAQMDGLNVREAIHPSTTTPSHHHHRSRVGDERPRPPPPYQATGPDWKVVPECPETRTVTYSLDWYSFSDVPDYVVCTRCFADHIDGTSLAGRFERITLPHGSLSRCVFWAPRVREILWPQAVQSNNMDALVAFLNKSEDMLACRGLAHSTGADGVKYFTMKENDIDGFIMCEECYEDWVVGTPFESRFTPYQQRQGQDDKWTCDLAIPYVRTAVHQMSKQGRWSEFVRSCTARVSLPVCDGTEIQSNQYNWYRPRRRIEGMHICEACYMDKLALTRFAGEFERHKPRRGTDGWTCALSDRAINTSFALGSALYQRNFDVFWDAAAAIARLVPCTGQGIIRGKWWTVAGGCPDLDVCEACYHGILLPSGLGRFFEQAQRDPGSEIICNFCPESPRFGQFINKFAEALDKGVFGYYADHVKKWAGVPSCPGIKSREKGRWWGYPDATFCQSCYLDFVAGTVLGAAGSLPVQNVYNERAMICQMCTPRMRNKWLAVCEAGPPGSAASEAALAEFRAFAQQRLQVYVATVPRIEMIEGMRQIRMAQAVQQGQLSIAYSGMNSMASLQGLTDGYMHGNSSIGWYETKHGVTAARMRHNMEVGMADANRMDDLMEVAQLKTLWLEVE